MSGGYRVVDASGAVLGGPGLSLDQARDKADAMASSYQGAILDAAGEVVQVFGGLLCDSWVKVNRRIVHCRQSQGHPSDGSTLFAYHSGAPMRKRKPGAYNPSKDSAHPGYSWTDQDTGQEIADRLHDPKRDTAPRVDTLTLDLFTPGDPKS